MAFAYQDPEDQAPIDDEIAAPAGGVTSRQLALRLSEEAMALAMPEPERRGKPSLRDVQLHISYLAGQIETLRRQLSDHPADRLAMLLREMIEERERELERWLAQEQRWDERLAAIESAIAERDARRARESELTRERDEARHAAAAAEARLDAARRSVEDANRRAAAMERAADLSRSEQLRLRHERELDSTVWQQERRRLATEAEPRSRGWLARLMRG